MMARIYQEATVVHAWLGNASDNSDLAMDLLSEFAEYLDVGGHRFFQEIPQYDKHMGPKYTRGME